MEGDGTKVYTCPKCKREGFEIVVRFWLSGFAIGECCICREVSKIKTPTLGSIVRDFLTRVMG